MKEIDDTPLPETESELPYPEFFQRKIVRLEAEINQMVYAHARLVLRVANLETQRTPQDENDDPEWY